MFGTDRLPLSARTAVHLRDSGAATVTDLARALDLSRTSVESSVTQLVAAGIVEETLTPAGPRGAGRPARTYEFRADAGLIAGLDVGTHSVRLLLADLAGVVRSRHSFPGLDTTATGAEQIDVVIGHLRQALASEGLAPGSLRAIGISLPGIVDATGRVLTSVIVPGWGSIDLPAQFHAAFGCPLAIDNGVRLAALAEHHLGAARLVDDVLYVSVGTRVSAGAILGGQARRGAHNVAGDIGRLAVRQSDPTTGEIVWRSAETGEDVARLAMSGDEDARAEIEHLVDDLGRSLALLTMAIDPAIVVIGGGMSLAREAFREPLARAVSRHTGLPFELPIVSAALGADAAAYGAVVFAFGQCADSLYGGVTLPEPRVVPLPAA
ncbi:ROK family protein [Microbacterium keratanolyticum]|uniref:ROK family transcriptional regulator n=1 Tax=Microbacterium keratanolyticum TaxID=67574 RepID=UPI0036321575